MANYLLIESCDPFEFRSVEFSYDLAIRLKNHGDHVTVFLVENGVLPTRTGAKSDRLGALLKLGIEVLADAYSLKERGITQESLAPGIKSSPLDAVIDKMAAGAKTIWH